MLMHNAHVQFNTIELKLSIKYQEGLRLHLLHRTGYCTVLEATRKTLESSTL